MIKRARDPPRRLDGAMRTLLVPKYSWQTHTWNLNLICSLIKEDFVNGKQWGIGALRCRRTITFDSSMLNWEHREFHDEKLEIMGH